MKYVKSLDGVRGLAILLVFLFHYTIPFEFGWVGVQLFFVLSGYLITSILLKEKSNSLGLYLKRFYWRRTLRIFPIYYAYLFLVTAIFLIKGSPGDFAARAPFLFTYTYNFYSLVSDFEKDIYFLHFWSLSIEEQFYLFWPLIVYFCSPGQLKRALVVMIVGAPLFRYFLAVYLKQSDWVDADLVGQVVYRMTPSQLDSFAFGALIPAFGLEATRIGKKAFGYFSLSVLVLLVFGVLNYWSMSSHGGSTPGSSLGYPIGGMDNLQHVWSYSIIGLVSMLLILMCLMNLSKVAEWVFNNTAMVFLGKYSYGLYIYHWILSMIYRVYLTDKFSEPVGFLVYSSACLVVAVLSYRVLERPFLSLKDKFYSRPEVSKDKINVT